MKRSVFSMSLLALALCAGCADTYYATTRTTTMGAGPAPATICQDGSVMQPNSACALHGGVDRQATYAGAFEHYY